MTRKILFSALAVSAAALLAQTDRAAASCVTPDIESGRYVNVDPNTRSITTAELTFVCGARYVDNGDGTGAVIHGGDPHWRVRLWGSCHPTDCDWGETRGASPVSGRITASYDQGFARRAISIAEISGDRIRLVVSSDYTDDRESRSWTEYMRLL